MKYPSMWQRCPNAEPLGQYALQNWQLEFRSVATVIRKPMNQVNGGLWRITPECEKALDALEGYPGWYEKHYEGDIMFYAIPSVDSPNIDDLCPPNIDYLQSVLIGLLDFGYPHPVQTLFSNMGRGDQLSSNGKIKSIEVTKIRSLIQDFYAELVVSNMLVDWYER